MVCGKNGRKRGPVVSSCTNSSPNIIRVIKSRRVGWAGNVARVGGQERCIRCVDGGDLRERDQLGGLNVDGKIIKTDVQDVG